MLDVTQRRSVCCRWTPPRRARSSVCYAGRLEEFGEIFEHTQWGVPPVCHTGAQYVARVLARQQRERDRERELAEERMR
jgi:hypothetical protein